MLRLIQRHSVDKLGNKSWLHLPDAQQLGNLDKWPRCSWGYTQHNIDHSVAEADQAYKLP